MIASEHVYVCVCVGSLWVVRDGGGNALDDRQQLELYLLDPSKPTRTHNCRRRHATRVHKHTTRYATSPHCIARLYIIFFCRLSPPPTRPLSTTCRRRIIPSRNNTHGHMNIMRITILYTAYCLLPHSLACIGFVRRCHRFTHTLHPYDHSTVVIIFFSHFLFLAGCRVYKLKCAPEKFLMVPLVFNL